LSKSFDEKELRRIVMDLCSAAEELREYVDWIQKHPDYDVSNLEDIILHLPFAVNMSAALLGHLLRNMLVDPKELEDDEG